MTDVLLPTWLKHVRNEFEYIDNTAVSRGLYTGITQSTGLGGDRMGGTLEYAPTGGMISIVEQGALTSFLMRMRGKQNRAYLFDKSYRKQGSFPATELIGLGTFPGGTSGFTAGAQNTNSVQNRVLAATRSTVSAATLSLQTSSGVTVTASTPYVLRAFIVAGKGNYPNTGFRFRAGTSLGDNSLFTGTTTTSFGMLTDVYTTGGATTTAFPALEDRNSAGVSVGDFFFVQYLSMSRCPLVNGALAANASAVAIDALPASTAGLLLPGDQFELITSRGSELKFVRNALNSDSSGTGYLMFDPPIRAAVADNSPVILLNPMSKCMYTGDRIRVSNDPGWIMNAAPFPFEEA